MSNCYRCLVSPVTLQGCKPCVKWKRCSLSSLRSSAAGARTLSFCSTTARTWHIGVTVHQAWYGGRQLGQSVAARSPVLVDDSAPARQPQLCHLRPDEPESVSGLGGAHAGQLLQRRDSERECRLRQLRCSAHRYTGRQPRSVQQTGLRQQEVGRRGVSRAAWHRRLQLIRATNVPTLEAQRFKVWWDISRILYRKLFAGCANEKLLTVFSKHMPKNMVSFFIINSNFV